MSPNQQCQTTEGTQKRTQSTDPNQWPGIIIFSSTVERAVQGGAVTQCVERWTCDQQVVDSNPTWGKSCVTTLGKSFTLMCLCHQAV